VVRHIWFTKHWTVFFDKTVDSTLYCCIFDDYVQQPDNVELIQGYFQQDSAMFHFSNVSTELIESFFPTRVTSKGLLPPPKSSDLTSPDFFLSGVY
jgi:hypothetical protein